MSEKSKWVFHCSRCGRFASEASGGFSDLYEAGFGIYEQGYPLCRECLKKEREAERKKREVEV